jgi:hypothetical protein
VNLILVASTAMPRNSTRIKIQAWVRKWNESADTVQAMPFQQVLRKSTQSAERNGRTSASVI